MNMQHSQTQRLLRKVDCAAISLLIVEDNDASRRLVMELLRAAGFTNLSFARDAEEAIEHLQAQAPDLLLMDWGLPGMSGLELVTLIRQSALTPDPRFPNPAIPVVMLTARQREYDVTSARNAGVNEFVIKPFSTSALLRAIASALVRKRRFVAHESFTGPDRRRRRVPHTGPQRRAEDRDAQSPLNADLGALRGFMGGEVDIVAVNEVVLRLMQTQTDAHEFRLSLVEQASQSLNQYMSLFGSLAEPEVVTVHLDALIRLNEVPYADPDEALNIVRHLNALVTKRRTSRRYAI
ncbi:MAG: response regulator [Asticcacaulis sp.]|uniref:response regulator n=1 Tax=Asticcacaulis sp. TaxID=1872648 RepID=UPI0039E617FF